MYAKQQTVDRLDASTMKARYQRAQALMQGLRTQSLVQNDSPLPHWIEQSDCFWYVRSHKATKIIPEEGGNKATYRTMPPFSEWVSKEYRLVNAKTLTNNPAFDHAALAEALASASERNVNADDLPISHVTVTIAPVTVGFTAFNRRWLYSNHENACSEVVFTPIGDHEALSPDGKQIAFCKDNNLWLRNMVNGEESPLTDDGEKYFSYATPPAAYGFGWPWAGLGALWSPDSRRLFVLQRDTRKVKTMPMVNYVPQNGGLRPTVEHIQVAYPGDDNVEEYRLLIIDIASKRVCNVDYRRIPIGIASDHGFFTTCRLGWWAADSQRAYFIDLTRGDQQLNLVELNANTGATRILFKEKSNTYIDIKPEEKDIPLHVFLPETDELIWWSERDGWGHLYLYDLRTGQLKNPITCGNWRVRDILHVDTEKRELLIQTGARVPGRNPYYRDICRVNIDTSEISILLSTDDEYAVLQNGPMRWSEKASGLLSEQASGVSPDGNYIITTRSRLDTVPVTVLLNRDGDILQELETADVSGLPDGWHWPEPVQMKAADGKTDIYGALFRPSGFTEDKQYPVINLIVGGPWLSAIPKGSFHNSRGYADRYYFQGAALAELGFIVVIIDSRGTPLRDKTFHDACYGWIPSSASTEDHRSGLEQLAARYPEMDISRVGVFSPTGYQGGLQNLMEAPDFYKVGVINMLQDSRFVGCTVEGDKYQGVNGPGKDKCFPEQLAEQWEGKLLLMHSLYGPLFNAYPPTPTLRMVDALRNANKDFDLLLVPNTNLPVMGSYEVRRAWDYLVRHLQNVEPPKEFKLGEFSW